MASGSGMKPNKRSDNSKRASSSESCIRKLRDSERRYRSPIETVGDWLWETDEEARFTYVSPTVRQLLGYKPEEVIGRHYTSFLPPEEAQRVLNYITPFRNARKPIKLFQLNMLRKDGSTVTVETSGEPVVDESGRFRGYRGIGRDITERKVTEDSLRRAQQFSDAVLNTLEGLVVVLDRRGRIVQFNPACERLTGWSAKEVAGKDLVDLLVPEEQREGVRATFDQLTAGSFPNSYENEWLTREGERRWISWANSAILDSSGQVEFVIGTGIDITQRKLAEAAMRESEEKYKNLVEATDTGYIIIDSEGRVIDANAEYVRLTGRNGLEDILGHSVLEWTAPHDLERNAEEVRKCAEKGYVRDLEIEYQWPDGTLTPIEVNANVVETREGRRIVALCRDITERRNAEQARRAFERQVENQKQAFYRDTIFSVTDGKLLICEPEEVRAYLASAEVRLEVRETAELTAARNKIARYCVSRGLDEDLTKMFTLAVGEALTNALKHAGRGRAFAGTTPDGVWAGVTDRGRGIESLILPKVVLKRGFSTKPSLGLGYSIMLELADRVLLSTGPTGTRVLLFKDRAPKTLDVQSLPDTWESIGEPAK